MTRAGCLRVRGCAGAPASAQIPVPFKSGYWLVGIVHWPNRAGLPGVARESCVLSTSRGPAPRQVGRDGSPVGGCASSASTGIDALLYSNFGEPEFNIGECRAQWHREPPVTVRSIFSRAPRGEAPARIAGQDCELPFV